jgi:hypothetical protein
LGPDRVKEDLKSAYEDLLGDADFQDAAQYDTSDTAVVDRRFAAVRRALTR